MRLNSNNYKFLYPLAFIFLTGCAGIDFGNNYYSLSVDSLATPDALSYQEYYLQPGKDVDTGLEYETFAEQVENTLDSKGLTRVDNPKQASAIITFSYKVGPEQQYPYVTSAPMWGPAGYPFGGSGFWVGNQYYPNTYFGPSFGFSSYQQITAVETVYPMEIHLAAKTNSSDKTKPIWEITVTAKSDTGDLRKSFPYFMRAAQNYIGVNTNGKQSVRVTR